MHAITLWKWIKRFVIESKIPSETAPYYLVLCKYMAIAFNDKCVLAKTFNRNCTIGNHITSLCAKLTSAKNPKSWACG